jgi:hypothetical protein
MILKSPCFITLKTLSYYDCGVLCFIILNIRTSSIEMQIDRKITTSLKTVGNLRGTVDVRDEDIAKLVRLGRARTEADSDLSKRNCTSRTDIPSAFAM